MDLHCGAALWSAEAPSADRLRIKALASSQFLRAACFLRDCPGHLAQSLQSSNANLNGRGMIPLAPGQIRARSCRRQIALDHGLDAVLPSHFVVDLQCLDEFQYFVIGLIGFDLGCRPFKALDVRV